MGCIAGCPARIRTWVKGFKVLCATTTLPGSENWRDELRLLAQSPQVLFAGLDPLQHLGNVYPPADAEGAGGEDSGVFRVPKTLLEPLPRGHAEVERHAEKGAVRLLRPVSVDNGRRCEQGSDDFPAC